MVEQIDRIALRPGPAVSNVLERWKEVQGSLAVEVIVSESCPPVAIYKEDFHAVIWALFENAKVRDRPKSPNYTKLKFYHMLDNPPLVRLDVFQTQPWDVPARPEGGLAVVRRNLSPYGGTLRLPDAHIDPTVAPILSLTSSAWPLY